MESGEPGRVEAACCCARELCVSVGVLGHVDSGKTSLCRALSQILSTASLDKHRQSQERGITLDLGFSAFELSLPSRHLLRCERRKARLSCTAAGRGEDELSAGNCCVSCQICLVDCPGHASLFRAVIGGAHIVQAALLVLDATKGLQAQSVECIVLAESLIKRLVVVLNKVDLIPPEERAQKLKTLTAGLRKVFAKTRFGSDVEIAAVSAHPGSGGAPEGVEVLLKSLATALTLPLPSKGPASLREASGDSSPSLLCTAFEWQRCRNCPCCEAAEATALPRKAFQMSYDHCFPVKGRGTVFTGTVLSGRLSVAASKLRVVSATGAVASTPSRVKSIQKFHKDVSEARTGERVAVCLTGVEVDLKIRANENFHCSIGHATAQCSARFFAFRSGESLASPSAFETESFRFDASRVYEDVSELTEETPELFALLTFDRPMLIPTGSRFLASRLDADSASGVVCRLAFEGTFLSRVALEEERPLQSQRRGAPGPSSSDSTTTPFSLPPQETLSLSALRVVRTKRREGVVERFVFEDEKGCVCRTGKKCEARAKAVVAKNLFSDAAHARRFQDFEAQLVACPPPEPSAPSSELASSPRQEWRLRVAGAFGGKGKSLLELKTPLGCTDTGVPGGLASCASFSVALVYCKNVLDKNQPLFQT